MFSTVLYFTWEDTDIIVDNASNSLFSNSKPGKQYYPCREKQWQPPHPDSWQLVDTPQYNNTVCGGQGNYSISYPWKCKDGWGEISNVSLKHFFEF